jgi:hypothetical protein
MTEMRHEHTWSEWRPGEQHSRDAVPREHRFCTTWACDTDEIRPVRERLPDRQADDAGP